MLGVTAILDGKLAYERAWQRETKDMLKQTILKTVEYLKGLGVSVFGIVGDNAANLQAALGAIQDECGILAIHCAAHSCNLLLKDMAAQFDEVFSRASALDDLFRNTHLAHTTYLRQMLFVPDSTLLRQSVPTRWGSQVALLESVVKNRVCIEQSLMVLRREHFSSSIYDAMGLGLLDNGQSLLALFQPLEKFI